MKKLGLLVMPLMAVSLLASCNNKTGKDGTIICGNIITMDEANPTAKAVGIKDGKIIALGTKEEVSNVVKGDVITKTFSNDEYIYPGFVDTHTHYAVMSNVMAGGAIFNREEPGKYGLGDYEAYANIVKEFVDANPDKEVYQAYGLWVADNPKYPAGQTPTAKMLDDVIQTDKPIVVIGAGGHDCWLNTAAINKYVGNTPDAVDKWINEVGEDCVIYETKDGHKVPTGYFCETARFRLTDNLPHTVDEIKDLVVGLQEGTLSKGYTTVGDCTIVESETNKQVTAFKQLSDEGKLKIKFRSYYEIREYDSEETRNQQLQYAIQLANETKNNDYFQIVGIKVFLDGVYEALSSYMLNEYTQEAGKRGGYKGIQRWYSDEQKNYLNELTYNANKAGLAMEFHAMGDAAIKQALDACEYSANKFNEEGKPYQNLKNAISHLGYIDPDGVDQDGLTEGLKDIERFNKLGVTAVVAPQWTCNSETIYPQEKKVLGETKVEDMYKIKSIIDTGANVAFHTDGAVLGGVPEMIYDATTRRSATEESSKVRGVEECITGEQSLKCLTTNAAYALNSNSTTGVIKVGAAADFSVYNKDYRNNDVATNLETFNTAQLLALYSNGRLIYEPSKSGLSTGAIVGISVGATMGTILITYIVLFIVYEKKKKGPKFLFKSFDAIHRLFHKEEPSTPTQNNIS